MLDKEPLPSHEVTPLEEALGYRFHDRTLLLAALRHPSAEGASKAEVFASRRLAFLGDAVWNFLVSHYLFLRLREASEGELSLLKAHLSSAAFLAELAKALGLPEVLYLGKGEERTGGRKKPSIVSSALEAVFAALYLDGGIQAASRLAERLLENALPDKALSKGPLDPKSHLQILAQANHKSRPAYRVVSKGGPPHEPSYEVEVLLNGEVLGRGVGKSKREAEQKAAEEALAALKIR